MDVRSASDACGHGFQKSHVRVADGNPGILCVGCGLVVGEEQDDRLDGAGAEERKEKGREGQEGGRKQWREKESEVRRRRGKVYKVRRDTAGRTKEIGIDIKEVDLFSQGVAGYEEQNGKGSRRRWLRLD